MLHRLAITTGDSFAPLSEAIDKRLVEARVEMELSRPTRFALRFVKTLTLFSSAKCAISKQSRWLFELRKPDI